MHLFLNNLTEGWTVRELYKNELVMPFSESPKVWMDTNFTLRGSGNTNDRRIYVVEFSDYFGKAHTPWDEFHNLLYDDWDEQEWMRFYNVCVFAIQRYMRWGLVAVDTSNYTKRKLTDDIPESAVDFFEDLAKDVAHPMRSYTDKNMVVTKGILERYMDKNPETKAYKGGMTQRKLRSFLFLWARANNLEINAHITAEDKRDRRRLSEESERIDLITITDPKKANSTPF
jgi:hypothetical protein